ncbi:rRNA methyltransferase 2, mitochondrial [Halocaridina rubra]|uniref:rRNA methyltransferase 2, mitochondrial n=1 Tax=Halocaridina rubra TaxID=373956 RepID=A0AAN9AA13_HALRR
MQTNFTQHYWHLRNHSEMKWNRTLILSVKLFHTSTVLHKIIPKSLKGKSKSSQDWLTRQLNDPYVKLAHQEQFRARSAFKLMEIDDRYKILQYGQVVVECGASPGAWTQVAVSRVNSLPNDKYKRQGLIIGIDLHTIHSLPGAIFLGGRDFTKQITQQQVLDILQGQKIDVVLSDMAPNASGTKKLDHENIISLAYAAFRFAVENSADDATFLCKIWAGFKDKDLVNDMKKFYGSVKTVKPPSSRSNSSEIFLLGRKFLGIKR